jgi:Arc/MetJ-type ribon-helix-helix transcriptional regulator
MPASRDGLASVSLGAAKKTGLRLVADGRFENLSEACRASLRRLADDARGIDDSFDIDAWIEPL